MLARMLGGGGTRRRILKGLTSVLGFPAGVPMVRQSAARECLADGETCTDDT